MSKSICLKVAFLIALMCSSSYFSQLVESDFLIWEYSSPTLREAGSMQAKDLVNFHPGIKNNLLKKYIKHRKKMSYTLSVVHASKEDEKIWEREMKRSVLSNHVYEMNGGKKMIQLKKKPSFFTLNSNAEKETDKTDSLKLSFPESNLFELIFIPKKSKSFDVAKIHSYLSIKYGISLEKGKYYSSSGKIIWDPEKHRGFSYRPTGLGRDDGNKLYQKQSCNQEDQFLTIGKGGIFRMNVENPSLFDQDSFVLWSDDNKEMVLKEKGDFKTLERNWEINFMGANISKENYQVRIDKSKINPNSLPLSYWMLLTGSSGEILKFKGIESENYIVFDKVDFVEKNKSETLHYFTFATSPISKKRGDEISSSEDIDLISENIGAIRLYPNPVKGGQEFTITFPAMENLSISIYDAGGRLLNMEKISSKAVSFSSSVDTQTLYIINLTKDGKLIKTFKLIVN